MIRAGFLLCCALLALRTAPLPVLGAEIAGLAKTDSTAGETINSASSAGFRALTEAEKTAARQDLNTIWSGYQSEIVTAEIDYLFLMFTLKSRQLTCDEFVAELQNVSLVADDSLARRLVEKFCPEKLKGTEEQNLATLNALGDWRTYRQMGTERRCVSKLFEHVVSDDLHLLVDHPNRGVRAYRRGDCNYFYETMDWFRFFPNDTLLADATFSTDEDDRYRLEFFGPAPAGSEKTSASWMMLGKSDGLPQEWRMISSHQGELLRMDRFQDLTLYPGDVLCPAVRIRARVEQGKVTTVRMTVIQRAEFNMPLEEDAFVLSVPANWSWFDWQLERHYGGRWKQPVGDAARFFRGRTVATAPAPADDPRPPVVRSWRSLLLIFNGALLIVIGVVLWRRSS